MLDLDLVRNVVNYYNSTESTVRKTSEVFGISKSTVYNYLTRVYPNQKSKEILRKNKIEAPLRGGESTRKMKLSLRS